MGLFNSNDRNNKVVETNRTVHKAQVNIYGVDCHKTVIDHKDAGIINVSVTQQQSNKGDYVFLVVFQDANGNNVRRVSVWSREPLLAVNVNYSSFEETVTSYD